MEQFTDKLTTIIHTFFAPTDRSAEGFKALANLMQEVAVSFGDCTICWGTGYLEKSARQSSHGVFKYCDCPRGGILKNWEIFL